VAILGAILLIRRGERSPEPVPVLGD